MSIHLPGTLPAPHGAAAPRSRAKDASSCNAIQEATQRLFAAVAVQRPDPPLDNLEAPSPAAQRLVRERLELLDIFGEAALDPLLPPAGPERPAQEAEGDSSPAPQPTRAA